MLTDATTWEAPGCPFQIEFATGKLDEIRLAVVEAFYAVPHGGIEIGGLLFGKREGKLLKIEDYRTVVCEHKTGPSFQLSDKDRAGLATLIASSPGELLGWFHSHTRSGIFLSPADLELYDAFFPEPWHVALVLRPANMQSTRAGYFFRDAQGKVAAEKSVCEFALESTVREETKKVRPPVNGIAKLPDIKTTSQLSSQVQASRPVSHAKPIFPDPKPVGIEPLVEIPPPAPPQEGASAKDANYSDLENELASRRRVSWFWVAAILAALIVAVGAWVTRSAWLPQPPPPLKLQASGVDEKLFIRWNPLQNTTGKLTVEEEGKKTEVPLDALQVNRGMYVYIRQAEKTILRMQAGASQDQTEFAGPLPPKGPTPEEIAKAKEAEKVKADLQSQTLRNRQLQRRVRELSNKLLEPKP